MRSRFPFLLEYTLCFSFITFHFISIEFTPKIFTICVTLLLKFNHFATNLNLIKVILTIDEPSCIVMCSLDYFYAELIIICTVPVRNRRDWCRPFAIVSFSFFFFFWFCVLLCCTYPITMHASVTTSKESSFQDTFSMVCFFSSVHHSIHPSSWSFQSIALRFINTLTHTHIHRHQHNDMNGVSNSFTCSTIENIRCKEKRPPSNTFPIVIQIK